MLCKKRLDLRGADGGPLFRDGIDQLTGIRCRVLDKLGQNENGNFGRQWFGGCFLERYGPALAVCCVRVDGEINIGSAQLLSLQLFLPAKVDQHPMAAAAERVADFFGGHPCMTATNQVDDGAGQGLGFGKTDFLVKPEAVAVEMPDFLIKLWCLDCC